MIFVFYHLFSYTRPPPSTLFTPSVVGYEKKVDFLPVRIIRQAFL